MAALITKYAKFLLVPVAIFSFIALNIKALESTSTNFQIHGSAIDSIAGKGTSTSQQNISAGGQTATGISTTTQNAVYSGILYWLAGPAITCTTPLDGQVNNFGTIDNTAIYDATTSSTTISSDGTVYMKVYDDGSGANPGLWKDPDLIESPWATMTDATATLSINMEGYGIMASTTSTNLAINIRYNKASSTNIIGALEQGVGNAVVVASSTNAVSGDVVNIDYKVSVSLTTPGGIYQDIITLVCSSG